MIFSFRKSICSLLLMLLCFPKEMHAQELQTVPYVDLGRYVGTW
jgi:lipocalin